MKKILLVLSLTLSTLFGAQITHDVADSIDIAHTFIGQSFTATGTESITSIQVASTNANTVTLRIYNGQTSCETAAGNGIVTAGAISTTAGLNFPDTNPLAGDINVAGTYSTLTLGTPLPITNTQQYTFCIESTAGPGVAMAYDGLNGYAGGAIYTETVGFFGTDLVFRINVATIASSPLSPKGYIALAFSFFGLAWYGSRNRKREVELKF